jgi:hypothetical protein
MDENKNGLPKSFTYVCVEPCTLKNGYYRKGDTITLSEKKEVPHFKLAEDK